MYESLYNFSKRAVIIRFRTTVRKNICYDLFVSRQVVKNATISLFFKKRQILAYGHTRVPKIFIRNGVCTLIPGKSFTSLSQWKLEKELVTRREIRRERRAVCVFLNFAQKISKSTILKGKQLSVIIILIKREPFTRRFNNPGLAGLIYNAPLISTCN